MPLTIEQRKKYTISPKGIKSHRIYNWKRQGIIDEDLSAVYDYYIEQTHCMICLKEYKNNKDRCLDHDHETGEIRYICCNKCNRHLLRTEFCCIQTKVSKNNTSGHLNIRYSERDKWVFEKRVNGERITKTFHTKEEAVQYKIDNNY